MTATLERATSVVAGSEEWTLSAAFPWVVREEIAPRVWKKDSSVQTLWLESNGSEGCYGGWDLRFPAPAGMREGDYLRFEIDAEAVDLSRGTDALMAEAFWHDAAGAQVDWDPIFFEGEAGLQGPEKGEPASPSARFRARYAARLRYPAGAVELRVRCGIRWSRTGCVGWQNWRLRPVASAPPRLLRLGVASAQPERWVDMWTNRTHYAEQC
ncbi:MAG TPA: hypothetical protein VGW38_13365, partial [Chloroflexota bacterium]|nr:hypothetical protein [Chloroflexota bacterium]